MQRRSRSRPCGRAPRALLAASLFALALLLSGCGASFGKSLAEGAASPGAAQSLPGAAGTRVPQNQSVLLVTTTPGGQAGSGAPTVAAQPPPPGSTPDVKVTVQAALAATLAAAPSSTLPTPTPSGAFIETFDDNRNGWFETHDAPVREVWIEGGEYHYMVKAAWEGPGHSARPWEAPTEPLARVYGDVSVLVRVRGERGTQGYGGLALCIDDIKTSYYLFVVYADGGWSVEKRLGREWVVLRDATDSFLLNAAPESNSLQLVHNGSEIAFYANGVQLGSVSDRSLGTGYVGVVVGEWREAANSHWVFDDFQVQAPE